MIYSFIFLIISGINGNINYISINRPEVITMSLITINGTQYNVTENIKLMPFLRDNLHLTSVKNGCNEGACGTCTVIIDGRAMKACVQKTANLDGKTVIRTYTAMPSLRPELCSAASAYREWSCVQRHLSTKIQIRQRLM